jgi:hypothetical protein
MAVWRQIYRIDTSQRYNPGACRASRAESACRGTGLGSQPGRARRHLVARGCPASVDGWKTRSRMASAAWNCQRSETMCCARGSCCGRRRSSALPLVTPADAMRSRMRIDGDRCMRTSVIGSSGELAAALGADASAEARARDATLPPEDALTVMKAYHRRRTRTRGPATTKEPLSLPLYRVRERAAGRELLSPRGRLSSAPTAASCADDRAATG